MFVMIHFNVLIEEVSFLQVSRSKCVYMFRHFYGPHFEATEYNPSESENKRVRPVPFFLLFYDVGSSWTAA